MDPSTPSHHTNIGAIVGGVVGGVVGLLLVTSAVVWFVRRRKGSASSSTYPSCTPSPHNMLTRRYRAIYCAPHADRHAFDPSKLHITELSPRSPTTADSDAKFQPYARMEDDEDVKLPDAGHLGVPTLAYSSGNGLRARSRSPAPDRKSMA